MLSGLFLGDDGGAFSNHLTHCEHSWEGTLSVGAVPWGEPWVASVQGNVLCRLGQRVFWRLTLSWQKQDTGQWQQGDKDIIIEVTPMNLAW